MMSEAYSLGKGSCPNTDQITAQLEFQRQILMESKLDSYAGSVPQNPLNYTQGSDLLIIQ